LRYRGLRADENCENPHSSAANASIRNTVEGGCSDAADTIKRQAELRLYQFHFAARCEVGLLCYEFVRRLKSAAAVAKVRSKV